MVQKFKVFVYYDKKHKNVVLKKYNNENIYNYLKANNDNGLIQIPLGNIHFLEIVKALILNNAINQNGFINVDLTNYSNEPSSVLFTNFAKFNQFINKNNVNIINVILTDNNSYLKISNNGYLTYNYFDNINKANKIIQETLQDSLN